MKILGIESSCDETAAAIVEDGVKIISHAVATSLDIQSQYGGVVPEVAARKQVEFIIPVLKETFAKAEMTKDDIDAIAVTVGPGLMGSLLVGVETAKVLSCLWKKPLIPVNHLVGHIYSGWLDDSAENKPAFPLIALIASGGHTDLVLMKGHGQLEKIGQTRDDAVGEAFDKVAKMLDLGYPGGPIVERMAVGGDPEAFDFPRPMISSSDLDFSYSGLKTAVLYKVRDLKADGKLDEQAITDICASFQEAAFDVLVTKTMHAAQQHNVKSILVTGGVAASRNLKKRFEDAVATFQPLNHPHRSSLNFGGQASNLEPVSLHIPPLKLATDNATYIAAAGYFLFDQQRLNPEDEEDRAKVFHLQPNPNLGVTDVIHR